jgi:hypothetical protein
MDDIKLAKTIRWIVNEADLADSDLIATLKKLLMEDK